MKNLIVYSVLLVCFFATKNYGQESFENRAKSIANNIESITKEEKSLLKSEVEAVNLQLEKGTISKEQADVKKNQLAQFRAQNIEKKVAAEQLLLNKLVQEKVDGKIMATDSTKKRRSVSFSFKTNIKKNDTLPKSEKRTTSQFVFAAGLNNVTTNGTVANSDFKYWGSHFYEWGITYNTRLDKNSNLFHIKYGFSLQYNNLRATENRLFVANNSQTVLISNPINQDDSRFKNVYLVFPVHFELDFSPTKTRNGKKVFQSHEGFRLGLGGYLGTNLKSKQYLEYNSNGYKTETETCGDFNTSNFIYGTSAYVGYKETSLYIKYDLNPLFRDNVAKQNNVSLGIRFDFN